ncbi:unnamed protein product [Hydatigera taeniaeformis]|uniref:Secreted protein n=1 Tax=Hydatigena taeniaeformis TaxID=6205 RepID=A0A0R3X2Y1_HYDTA|nr:unnamed protein product [Hydatigera taeniaeformis]
MLSSVKAFPGFYYCVGYTSIAPTAICLSWEIALLAGTLPDSHGGATASAGTIQDDCLILYGGCLGALFFHSKSATRSPLETIE